MGTDLLLITPGFPRDAMDSTCVPPLQEYLIALRAARPDLSIAVIATQYPFVRAAYSWQGIMVHPCDGRNSLLRRPGAVRRAQRAFRSIAGYGPIRCVHSLWIGHASAFAAQCATSATAPHVVTAMGQDARDAQRWWRKITGDPVPVAISQRQAAHFEGMAGRAAGAVVPWGSPRPVTRTTRENRDIDILFVGSMIEVKRPQLFHEVFHKVRTQHPVNAVMIGRSSAERGTELQQWEFAMAGSTLRMVDELPRERVLEHMTRARVLVHTASYEGQGYVFDEALACGMSIASFPVGSATPSDRWRVVADVDAMAASIIELLADAPSDTPVVLHPMERTVNDYLKLYGLR